LCGQTSWKGTSSTAWGTAANWTAGVPTSTVDAIIGDANFTGSNQPDITQNATCKSLTVGAGTIASTLTVDKSLSVSGNVTIGANGTITHNSSTTISLTGNWSNSGTYNGVKSGSKEPTVTFAGTTQSITGATTFRKLTINSGSTTVLNANLVVNKALSVSGT